MFKPGFSSLTLLEAIHGSRRTGLSPSLVDLSRSFVRFPLISAFARRYLRSRCCFPFLQLLRCFSSLRSLYRSYTFRPESPYGGVAPFGDPRITA